MRLVVREVRKDVMCVVWNSFTYPARQLKQASYATMIFPKREIEHEIRHWVVEPFLALNRYMDGLL